MKTENKSLNEYKFFLKKNKKNKRFLVYVLCGYKGFLYKNLFERLKRCVKSFDADYCLVSCGKYDKFLLEIAKKNGWCYFSSKLNKLLDTQNAVISMFSKAEIIIKMDEDIMVTNKAFNKLKVAYDSAKKAGTKIAFVAPILNINGYGSIRLLELLQKKELGEKLFGKLKYGYGRSAKPETNLDLVKFLWNVDGRFIYLDSQNKMVEKINHGFTFCKKPFSIGLILFERKFWYLLNNSKLKKLFKKDMLGGDEKLMNLYSKYHNYKRVICNNCVCGHLSFRKLNPIMKEIYQRDPKIFELKEKK